MQDDDYGSRLIWFQDILLTEANEEANSDPSPASGKQASLNDWQSDDWYLAPPTAKHWFRH